MPFRGLRTVSGVTVFYGALESHFDNNTPDTSRGGPARHDEAAVEGDGLLRRGREQEAHLEKHRERVSDHQRVH